MKVGGEEGAAGAAGAASGEGRARLVAIGNGGVGAAERWRKMVQFEGEVFVSPTLDAYKDRQLVYGSKPVSKAVYCERWCDGFWKALSIVCCIFCCVCCAAILGGKKADYGEQKDEESEEEEE